MRAVIFDLDGTLIDSAPEINGIANRVLEAENLAPITLADTRRFIGEGAGVFVSRMMAARGVDPSPRTHKRLLADFIGFYDHAVSLTRLYPHVRETLTALAAEGFRLGICTNKPLDPTRFVLEHFGLAPLFPVIIGGDSLPQRKPDPAPLRAAIEQLGAPDVVFVGDSEIDAETARAAGVPFALFTKGYRKSGIADMPHDLAFSDYSDLSAGLNGIFHR
ncbi:MAG: phosphoglycolate phosphatase [Paracoccaceae bacterium]